MKVDQATFAAHGAALLEAAGRLFRDRGLDVSVAEVSRAAGLTHGAFYGHFDSKDALAAESCRRTLLDAAARWRARAAAAPHDPIGAIVDGYLTEQHRDEPGGGCVLPSLGPEAARADGAVAAAVEDGTHALLAVLTEELARAGPTAGDAAARALALLALMSGGVMLARALKSDPARSAASLQAARDAARLLAHPTPPG